MNNERNYDEQIDNARSQSKDYEEKMHSYMSIMENTVLDKITYKNQVKTLEDKIKSIQGMDLSDFEKEIAINKLNRDLEEVKEKISNLDNRISLEKERYDFHEHEKDRNERVVSSLEKSKEVAMENRENTKEDKKKMSRKKLAVVSKYIELYPDSEIAELVDSGLNINDIYDDNYKEIHDGLNNRAQRQQEMSVKASQERYNSTTSEERQQEAISNYGIDSEQGKKAKETNDRINGEIQRDKYNDLIKNDTPVDVDVVVKNENENDSISLDEIDFGDNLKSADTLVMGKDVVENENGEIVYTEATSSENAAGEVEQPQLNADLTPEPSRLVSMISGVGNKLKGIINSNPNAAVAACIAIAGAVAVIVTGPVGLTALGAIAQTTGSAAFIGGGAYAANEFVKGKK